MIQETGGRSCQSLETWTQTLLWAKMCSIKKKKRCIGVLTTRALECGLTQKYALWKYKVKMRCLERTLILYYRGRYQKEKLDTDTDMHKEKTI